MKDSKASGMVLLNARGQWQSIFSTAEGCSKQPTKRCKEVMPKYPPKIPAVGDFVHETATPNVGSQGLGIVVYPGFGLVLQRHPHLRCSWLMETPQNSPHWLIKM